MINSEIGDCGNASASEALASPSSGDQRRRIVAAPELIMPAHMARAPLNVKRRY
jgi:hypothetical protein